MFYTSMPVVVLGVFDKDVDATASHRYSKLYTPGIRDAFFNRRVFAMEAVKGLYSSLMLMGLPAGTLTYLRILGCILLRSLVYYTILKFDVVFSVSIFGSSFFHSLDVSDTNLFWCCKHFLSI